MLDTVRLYFEATVAVALMAMFAIIFWICLSRIDRGPPAGLPCRCRGVRAHGDRTDGAPVAHDQNTDPSPGAAHLTRRAAPAAPRERVPA